MTKRYFFFLLAFFTFSSFAVAQTLETKTDTLLFYGDVLSNASLDKHRVFAAENFNQIFREILQEGSESFEQLKDLPLLAVNLPPDSSFVLYTWRLSLRNNSEFHYFGFIQSMRDEFEPIELKDHMQSGRVTEYATFTPDHWPAAFYYNMKAFNLPDGEEAFLLFGINGNTRFNRIRVMDVLFRQGNQFYFGLPVFGEEGENIARTGKTRIMMEYSFDAPIFLNFDHEYGLVVLNRLDRKEGIHPGQGMTGIPSGEYMGYRYKDGYWVFVPEVVRKRSIPEATPPPPPQRDRPRRDLFGRPIQN